VPINKNSQNAFHYSSWCFGSLFLFQMRRKTKTTPDYATQFLGKETPALSFLIKSQGTPLEVRWTCLASQFTHLLLSETHGTRLSPAVLRKICIVRQAMPVLGRSQLSGANHGGSHNLGCFCGTGTHGK